MNRLLIGSSDKTDLLLQFLAEDFSLGVTIIDTTGEFARLAANILPMGLTQQALYLDGNLAHPLGLNVLDGVLEDDRQRLTEQLCALFDLLFPQGENTLTRALSTFLLANCLRLLLDTEGTTLLGVLKLLKNTEYRSLLLERCTGPVVKENWRIIFTWKEAQYIDLYSKMGTLLMSPLIRNMVGQTETTFGNVPIVIADLDRAKLGDTTAKLLGGLLLARATGVVYIPDFSFFAADQLAEQFTQDRFTVALNFLPTRFPALREALLGIEKKFVFKTTKRDAEELAHHVNLIEPNMLIDLKPDQFRTPFSFHAQVAHPPPLLKRLKALKRRTRARYTRPRNIVERTIERYFSA